MPCLRSIRDGQKSGNQVERIVKPAAASLLPAMPLAQAWDIPTQACPLGQCAGRVAGEFINLYPPGIPSAVPGEILTEEWAQQIRGYLEMGLCVQGIQETGEGRLIQVLSGYNLS